jgi:hypothetical protein
MEHARRIGARLVALTVTCGIAALSVIGATSAFADPLGARGGAIFRLDAESWYQQGCFPPCMCPIMEPGEIRGTLTLIHLGEAEGIQRYAVDDVNWTVSGDPALRIIGAGRYAIGNPGMLPVNQHRMQLDLAVGDQPVQHFDSGWITATDPGTVSITISLNNMYCWDTAIVIDASRVPHEEIYPHTLMDGSTFQRGCFDPCDCPVGREQPMEGTFALVPLMESLPLTEFAVVGVKWHIRSVESPSTIPVSGFGVYQLLGDFALQHRLALDLVVGQEARTGFDSGPVFEGVGSPSIDIVASMNGVSCTDTVLHVAAEPDQRRACGGFAGLPCENGEFCSLPVGSCCCDHVGACTPIPDACPTVWDPVCGCDGMTYGNECEAAMAAVSLAHYGACGEPCFTDADCGDPDHFCRHRDGACGATGSPGECTTVLVGFPDVWDPVCGCDGVTYDNELEADAAGVSIRHHGECRRGPGSRRHFPGDRHAPAGSSNGDQPSQVGG